MNCQFDQSKRPTNLCPLKPKKDRRKAKSSEETKNNAHKQKHWAKGINSAQKQQKNNGSPHPLKT